MDSLDLSPITLELVDVQPVLDVVRLLRPHSPTTYSLLPHGQEVLALTLAAFPDDNALSVIRAVSGVATLQLEVSIGDADDTCPDFWPDLAAAIPSCVQHLVISPACSRHSLLSMPDPWLLLAALPPSLQHISLLGFALPEPVHTWAGSAALLAPTLQCMDIVNASSLDTPVLCTATTCYVRDGPEGAAADAVSLFVDEWEPAEDCL